MIPFRGSANHPLNDGFDPFVLRKPGRCGRYPEIKVKKPDLFKKESLFIIDNRPAALYY